MPLLSDAKNCFVGNTQIEKVYAGADLVWPKNNNCDMYPPEYESICWYKFENNLLNSVSGYPPLEIENPTLTVFYTDSARGSDSDGNPILNPDGYCAGFQFPTNQGETIVATQRRPIINKAIKFEFSLYKKQFYFWEERQSAESVFKFRTFINRPGEQWRTTTITFGISNIPTSYPGYSGFAVEARILNAHPSYKGPEKLTFQLASEDLVDDWYYFSMDYHNDPGLWSICFQPLEKTSTAKRYYTEVHEPFLFGINEKPEMEYIKFNMFDTTDPDDIYLDNFRFSTIDELPPTLAEEKI